MKPKTEFTKKYYADLWKVMKAILDEEHETPASDPEMVKLCKAKGIWASRITIRECRVMHDIGTKKQRVITNFARDFKKGNK